MVEKQKVKVSLLIKALSIPNPTEATKVTIYWSRGKSKAQTAIKEVTSDAPIAKFDDKFQMATDIEIDTATGKPTAEKKSKITAFAGENFTDLIGKCELNLADYGNNEYKKFKIMLTGGLDQFNGAYVEGQLKGVPPPTTTKQKTQPDLMRQTTTMLEPPQSTTNTKEAINFEDDFDDSQSMMSLASSATTTNGKMIEILAEIETLQKQKDKAVRVFALQSKRNVATLNDVMTQSENIRTDLQTVGQSTQNTLKALEDAKSNYQSAKEALQNEQLQELENEVKDMFSIQTFYPTLFSDSLRVKSRFQ